MMRRWLLDIMEGQGMIYRFLFYFSKYIFMIHEMEEIVFMPRIYFKIFNWKFFI